MLSTECKSSKSEGRPQKVRFCLAITKLSSSANNAWSLDEEAILLRYRGDNKKVSSRTPSACEGKRWSFGDPKTFEVLVRYDSFWTFYQCLQGLFLLAYQSLHDIVTAWIDMEPEELPWWPKEVRKPCCPNCPFSLTGKLPFLSASFPISIKRSPS